MKVDCILLPSEKVDCAKPSLPFPLGITLGVLL
jgi:hypothetical protein